MSGKRLIMGVGNEILMDDGIGPKVVLELEKRWPLPGVEYQTTTLGGMEVVEMINGYEWVVFVDAIKTKDGAPGEVYEFTVSDFKETLHLTNLHDISFVQAVELGKTLGFKIPEHIYIYAIEIIEDQVFGEEFTPPLQEKYEAILEEIQELISRKA